MSGDEHGDGPLRHRISAGVLALREADDALLLVNSRLAGRYDFWVAPGGGVRGTETLQQAAEREALEETGLRVRCGALLYVEEFHSPETRHCKFWFAARCDGGTPRWDSAAAQAEHIVQAAWLPRAALAGLTLFPELLRERFWADRAAGRHAPGCGALHLGLRAMDFW